MAIPIFFHITMEQKLKFNILSFKKKIKQQNIINHYGCSIFLRSYLCIKKK